LATAYLTPPVDIQAEVLRGQLQKERSARAQAEAELAALKQRLPARDAGKAAKAHATTGSQKPAVPSSKTTIDWFRGQQRNITSQHYCIGGDENRHQQPEFNPMLKSCMFRNLCVEEGRLIYFSGNASSVSFHSGSRKVEGIVRLKPGFNAPSNLWAPRITPGNVPNSAFWVMNATVFMDLHHHGHFGHWLLNNMAAAFMLLELFNMDLAPEVTILHDDDGCENMSWEKCRKFESNTFGSVRQVWHLRVSDIASVHGSRPVCFRTVLTGAGKFGADAGREDGMAMAGLSSSFRHFRRWLLSRIISPTIFEHLKQHKLITVLRKDANGKHSFINHDEIMARLRLRFESDGWEVEELRAGDLPSLKDQVIRMQRTSILITPPGGIGHIDVFMQDVSVVIVGANCYPCVDSNDISGTKVDPQGSEVCCIKMDGYFQNYLPNLHTLYYFHDKPSTLFPYVEHGQPVLDHWGDWRVQVNTQILVGLVEESIAVLKTVNHKA